MNKFFKLIDLLRVLIVTKQPFFSIFKKGFSIASSQIVHSLFKVDSQLKTIIDVGANQGQFALACSYFYKEAIIYSFEPVPETAVMTKLNTKHLKNIKVFEMALGSIEGSIDFYKNEYSHASSALPVSKLQLESHPQTSRTEIIKVPVRRLDDMMESIPSEGKILLKLDVQGFEKEVLMGATSFIKKVDYILFEASFVSMYDGEPLYEEMHSYVSNLGFEIVAPMAFLQTDSLQIMQMDMLYRRKFLGDENIIL
jgi:FkbM family methyltransferase